MSLFNPKGFYAITARACSVTWIAQEPPELLIRVQIPTSPYPIRFKYHEFIEY